MKLHFITLNLMFKTSRLPSYHHFIPNITKPTWQLKRKCREKEPYNKPR